MASRSEYKFWSVNTSAYGKPCQFGEQTSDRTGRSDSAYQSDSYSSVAVSDLFIPVDLGKTLEKGVQWGFRVAERSEDDFVTANRLPVQEFPLRLENNSGIYSTCAVTYAFYCIEAMLRSVGRVRMSSGTLISEKVFESSIRKSDERGDYNYRMSTTSADSFDGAQRRVFKFSILCSDASILQSVFPFISAIGSRVGNDPTGNGLVDADGIANQPLRGQEAQLIYDPKVNPIAELTWIQPLDMPQFGDVCTYTVSIFDVGYLDAVYGINYLNDVLPAQSLEMTCSGLPIASVGYLGDISTASSQALAVPTLSDYTIGDYSSGDDRFDLILQDDTTPLTGVFPQADMTRVFNWLYARIDYWPRLNPKLQLRFAPSQLQRKKILRNAAWSIQNVLIEPVLRTMYGNVLPTVYQYPNTSATLTIKLFNSPVEV